ncbi:MAG: outer membrane lipoprotein chaperone LolA [Porticoccaceae bacterium]
MRFTSRILGALLAALFAVAAAGGPEDIAELGNRLAPMKNLSAGFNQTVTSADGYIIQEITGTLTVARPGKVRWESDAPYEQLVVSDAETLWLYDPDLEQVTVRPFSHDISRTPAVLFIGEVKDLARDYQVSAEREGERSLYWLEPVNGDALYERISIEFDGDIPVAMALWDSLGQVTRIGFSNATVNGEVDPAAFHFTPPPGVDVLHDE